jgi:S1-C subfamily serine protease
VSEHDPRWTGRQDNPGQPGEASNQGQPGATPADPGQAGYQGHPGQAGYQGQPGYYGQPGYPGAGAPGGQPGPGQPGDQEFRGGPGLGGPAGNDPGAWPGYQYQPQGGPGEFGHTQQFGQPTWAQQTGQWVPPAAYQQPRRRPLRTVGIALGAVGLSVLVGLGIGRIAWSGNTDNTTALGGGNQNFGSAPTTPGGTSNTSINPSAIAAKVDPGLVDINTVLGYQSAEAAGTGIVLTSNGEILTNNHVVEGATSIKVTDIGNGKTYTASVVGYDRTQDIAVLQLQGASGLATETLGDSSKVATGDAVVGIGNAGGAGGTPSAASGTVTALNQSITASDGSSGSSEQLTGLIQVNANIQSGDSGGALVNSAGQVIGVDTAASQGYQFSGGGGFGGQGTNPGTSSGNQGYAIPINQAITLAHQIIAGTSSSAVHIGQSAFLGVSVSDPGASQQGNQGTPSATSGAQIVGTLASGPAQAAGLQQGDVITAVNGQTIDSATALTNLMDTHHPGDKLTLTYTDSAGQQHTTTVTTIQGPVG